MLNSRLNTDSLSLSVFICTLLLSRSTFTRIYRIHGSFHRGRERGHPERLATVGVGRVGGVGETDWETVEKCVQELSLIHI